MVDDRMFQINGVCVTIVHPVKVENKIKRSWYERLLTLPFNPFTKYRITHKLVDVLEDGQVLKSKEGFHMTIKTWDDCQKALLTTKRVKQND